MTTTYALPCSVLDGRAGPTPSAAGPAPLAMTTYDDPQSVSMHAFARIDTGRMLA